MNPHHVSHNPHYHSPFPSLNPTHASTRTAAEVERAPRPCGPDRSGCLACSTRTLYRSTAFSISTGRRRVLDRAVGSTATTRDTGTAHKKRPKSVQGISKVVTKEGTRARGKRHGNGVRVMDREGSVRDVVQKWGVTTARQRIFQSFYPLVCKMLEVMCANSASDRLAPRIIQRI